MKVFLVIKNCQWPDDELNRELVEFDCVKATLDGALERIKELAVDGHRGADFREIWFT